MIIRRPERWCGIVGSSLAKAVQRSPTRRVASAPEMLVTTGYRRRARTRKVAICARVMICAGQYRSPPQPMVIPAAPRALMLAAWLYSAGTSEKRPSPGGSAVFIALARNVAHLCAGEGLVGAELPGAAAARDAGFGDRRDASGVRRRSRGVRAYGNHVGVGR